MQRKETYATTGSRMTVRLFGGWDFTEADTQTRLPARAGYSKGVPMGGDLHRMRGRSRRAQLSRCRHEGPLQRKPRPHSDHQRLAR